MKKTLLTAAVALFVNAKAIALPDSSNALVPLTPEGSPPPPPIGGATEPPVKVAAESPAESAAEPPLESAAEPPVEGSAKPVTSKEEPTLIPPTDKSTISAERQKADSKEYLTNLKGELEERRSSSEDLKLLLKEQREKRKEAQKDVQRRIQRVMNDLNMLEEGSSKIAKNIKKEKEKFMKRLRFRTVPEGDIPRVKSDHSMKGLGSADCPVDCDPTFCDSIVGSQKATQCYSVNSEEFSNKRNNGEPGGAHYHICSAFADEVKETCPTGFQRCALAAPERDHQFTQQLSPIEEVGKKKRKEGSTEGVEIKGKNLQQCLVLVAVPSDVECSVTNSQDLMSSSEKITQGRQSFPKVNKERTRALFEDFRLQKEGMFKLCVVQFSVSPKTAQPLILATESIGTINVVRNNTMTTVP